MRLIQPIKSAQFWGNLLYHLNLRQVRTGKVYFSNSARRFESTAGFYLPFNLPTSPLPRSRPAHSSQIQSFVRQ